MEQNESDFKINCWMCIKNNSILSKIYQLENLKKMHALYNKDFLYKYVFYLKVCRYL
jgi:hypothetical protein